MSFITRRRAAATTALAAAALVGLPVAAQGAGALLGHDNTQAARQAIVGGKARSVILLIGDGMGDSEITSARNYEKGANGRLAMDTLPLTGAYTTYAVAKGQPTLPDYVTDSAASGSGWATGVKTYNGAISVDAYGKPTRTLLEMAKKQGYRTGDVTTAELQDATPAVLASHVVSRDCKGPDAMATCPSNDKLNGGAGSIAEQMVATHPDLMLGGGSKYFDQTVKAGRFKGLTVAQQAQVGGYQVVRTADELAAANPKKPVLGTFATGNMDLEWTGPTPTHDGTAPTRCATNAARTATQPHLSTMAQTAISALDKQARGQQKGFFLQIEGASIDKQDHAANPCGQIGELIEFDKAVKAALAYQQKHPDTLVVTTADHGHTSQIVPAGWKSPGVTATLLTNEGAPMTISYATSTYPDSQEHTGTEVRIAAGGPQAANVLGVTNQTDLNTTVRRALALR